MTGAVLTVPGFRLASNYNYVSTAIRKILLFDALIMIHGKLIFIFDFGQSRIRSARKFERVENEKSIKY